MDKILWTDEKLHNPKHIICQIWCRQCHGMGMYGCQWNWLTHIYWWCNCYTVCSDSAKCRKTDALTLSNWKQMDNVPKHIAEATQELLKAKKRSYFQWSNQSPGLNPFEHAFHLFKTKLKVEQPTNPQAATEEICSKGMVKPVKCEKWGFGDVRGCQTSSSH